MSGVLHDGSRHSEGLSKAIVLESGGHSVNFRRGGADLARDGAPRGGGGRHILENDARFVKGQREIVRRGLEEVDRAGAFFEVNVRREHPRLQICRNGNRDYRFGEIRDYAGDRPRWRPRR